jgi:hypothetical protein
MPEFEVAEEQEKLAALMRWSEAVEEVPEVLLGAFRAG